MAFNRARKRSILRPALGGPGTIGKSRQVDAALFMSDLADVYLGVRPKDGMQAMLRGAGDVSSGGGASPGAFSSAFSSAYDGGA